MGRLFRNAAIGVKVALAPAFAIACLLVVAAAGWAMNRSITAELDHVGTDGVARIVDAQAMAVQLTELHQRVYQSLTWEAVGQRAEMIKALDEALAKELAAYAKAADGLAGDDTLAPDQRATATEFAKGFATYAKSATDTLDIKSAGVATATSYVVTLDLEYKRNAELIRRFVQREQAITAASVEAAKTGSARHAVVTGAVTLLALAACVALTLLLTRAISQPLGQAAGMAGRLAEGDLTTRQSDASADATGRVVAALDEVSRNLSGMVADIRATAEQIDSASSEIATGNADLSSRTESTASALQQAAAAVEQLASTIRSSAEHARDANAMARSASDVAREGGTLVADVVSTMEAINVQAKRIGEIIGTIDGIAFQTNILALNAAVEAARAGEHGRGFSVVASEVRLLARRSGEAAREIRSLISSSVEQIDAGTDKVHAAGQTMGRIVGAIEQVADTVDGIARAAAEQASGIAQVNQTVAEMDRNTQQNAAMVEEASAAATSLRQQAAHLVQSIARFRTA